jgi:putative sugar O-methyltransferase
VTTAKYDFPELTLARDEMMNQEVLYRPTAFWDEASSKIISEINTHGINNFRSLPKLLSFFVPTYGTPGNAYSKELADKLKEYLKSQKPPSIKPELSLEQFLQGKMSAIADYRVFLAADNTTLLPHLHNFSESTVGNPVEQFEFDGRRFSRSSLNYLLGLVMLKKHLGSDELNTVLEIGGGFGTLSEILSSSGIKKLKYIDIDIPPTSYVAEYYLSEVLGRQNVTGFAQTKDASTIKISDLTKASVLCSWQIEKLQGSIDLFVNFISFQEMEPHIVKNYFKHVKRLYARWILLRNMREGKQVRKNNSSVGVDTPILSDDYLEMLPEYELVERNVLPFGFKTVDDFHSELMLLRRK